MALTKSIEIRQLSSTKAGMAEFYTPQASDETMLVQIAPHSIDDLFVHRHQTDQLLVVRGQMVLVVLLDRAYQYIVMRADRPQVVTIPPMVPHAAINLTTEPCMLINAVRYHGQPGQKDYQPVTPPFVYDLELVQQLFQTWPMAS
jgi:oxalate decarboxylase/phosphoglucose isomerase-like protein (cupin superfamily)